MITTVPDIKEKIIQGHCLVRKALLREFIVIGVGTTAMGSHSGKARFNCEHSMGEWEFIAEEHDGGQWMQN